MHFPWRIELFGGLRATSGARVVSRFRTHKTGALLGFLALHLGRPTPRETLLEVFWPDDALDDARNGLRVALASLRRQFEPPGEAGVVIVADRLTAGLSPGACRTDVADFEVALRRSDLESLAEAAALYRGELLSGYYDDWIFPEHERLATAYLGALRRLRRQLTEAGDIAGALDYAHKSAAADPFEEASHRALMRLHAAMGRPDAVRAQFVQLQTLLRAEMNAAPSPKTAALLRELTESHPVRPPAPKPSAPPFSLPAPLSQPAGRLPMTFTPFFGRTDELTQIGQRLGSGLLTLTGPGGSGKTRLATEAARQLWDDFAGRVWFVGLAEVRDARRVGEAIASALGLPTAAGLAEAAEFLDGDAALLVLDNAEQAAGGVAAAAMTLMTRCPNLACLVTSRRRLDVAGEREFPVGPLPTPADESPLPDALMAWPSVQLFADRAQAARADFAVTPRNAADVAALCRQLEGVPLAIELAAARARVLSPAQMRARLSERFELLATRRTDKTSRHRSLWAAVSWSFDLLPPALQGFWAQLSVFRGGWTLEAAEDVCAEPSALDFLTQLRAHSLVSAVESVSSLRFGLLESLREFAAEHLSDDDKLALARRHAAHVLACAQNADADLQGPNQARRLSEMADDLDNVRAAFEWTTGNDPNLAVQLASALWRFFYLTGRFIEGKERVTAALTASKESGGKARADALNGAGMLTWRTGENDAARALLGAAQAVFEELDDRAGQAAVLNNRAALEWSVGNLEEARAGHEESLRLKRALGDRWGEASSLNNLGTVARDAGDHAGAEAAFEASLRVCEELGDAQGMATAHNNLGNAAFGASNFAAARARYEKSLALKRELGNAFGCAVSLSNLGCVALHSDDYPAARAALEESLTLYRDAGARQGIASSLADLGRVAVAEGRLQEARQLLTESLSVRQSLSSRAALPTGLDACAELAAAAKHWPQTVRLFAAADRMRRDLTLPPEPAEVVRAARFLATARAALGPDAFARHQQDGAALSDEDALAEARSAV